MSLLWQVEQLILDTLYVSITELTEEENRRLKPEIVRAHIACTTINRDEEL